MRNPAAEMRTAAQALRDVAPDLTGPLAGLADPVAEWLDACADAPVTPLHTAGLRVARIVNGTPACICTEDAWPPHCPVHGIDV